MPTLLAVGFTEERENWITRFARLGYRVVVIDEPGSPSLVVADSGVAVSSLFDAARLSSAIETLAARHGIDGIVTFFDECIPVVAAAARRLGLPALSETAALAALDKVFMRDLLDRASVPQPSYSACSSSAEAISRARAMGYPLCVKPANQSGSIGVSKVTHDHQLPGAVEVALAARLYGEGSILLEAWASGIELDVEVLTIDGHSRVLCSKLAEMEYWDGVPVCVQTTLPYDAASEEVAQVSVRALDALEVDNTISCVQVTIGDTGPVVIEVNARTSGSISSRMIEAATGVDVCAAVADLALGRRPFVTPKRLAFVSTRIVFSEPGTVVGVDGLEEAQSAPGVTDVYIRRIELPTPSRRPLPVERGLVAAVGPTFDAARDRALHAAQLLRIRVKR